MHSPGFFYGNFSFFGSESNDDMETLKESNKDQEPLPPLSKVSRQLFKTPLLIPQKQPNNSLPIENKQEEDIAVPDVLFPELPQENFSKILKSQKFNNNTPYINKPTPGILNNLAAEVKIEEPSPLSTPITHKKSLTHRHKKSGSRDKVEEALKEWCLENNIPEDFKKQYQTMEEQNIEVIKPVYRFQITVDVANILDFNVELGEMAMKVPVKFCKLLCQVCYNLMNFDGWIIKLTCTSQLLISPKFLIPAMEENEVTDVRDSKKMASTRLFRFNAQVVAISYPVQYTTSATYKCECGNITLLTASFELVEDDVIRNEVLCNCCAIPMEEEITQRKTDEKLYCFGVAKSSKRSLQSLSSSDRLQAIKLAIKDISSRVVVGENYWFTGVFKHHVTGYHGSLQNTRVTFEVFTVEQDTGCITNLKGYQRMLPDSLCSLYNDRKCSPWSFVTSLAYGFGDEIVEGGTYHLLKMCLLLSLVMEGDQSKLNQEHTNNNIHILVQEQDVLPVQRLLLHASALSGNPVVHHHPCQLFATVNEDDTILFADGGSLPLASNGACVIPNLNSLKKKDQLNLAKALEENVCVASVPVKQHEESRLQQFILPLTCATWACCETKVDNSAKTDIMTVSMFQDTSSIPPVLESQFHVMFSTPMDVEQSTNYHLQKFIYNPVHTESMIPTEELYAFVSRCRSNRCEMSEEIYYLLNTYYLTCRRSNISHLTKRTLHTLCSIAVGHGKLMLHPRVTVDDAIASIYIVEQLQSQNGESLTGVVPAMHFTSKDMHYIGPENDRMMHQFKRHVIQLCANFYPKLSSLLNS